MDKTGASLPPELAERVAAELATDEELLWIGQPRLDLAVRPAYFLVPFGIVFTGFALVWVFVSFLLTFGLMAPCGLPFIAVGVGLVASPVWLRALARKTAYGVTGRRAIIWQPSWFGRSTVQSFTASGLGQLTRTQRPDGSGDLVFQVAVTGFGDNSRTERRGFLAINHVKDVEELVRKTLLADR